MEENLFKTKVGPTHKINVLKNYKKVVQKRPRMNQQLTNVFQDLAWGVFNQGKWDQVVSDTIPPENL